MRDVAVLPAGRALLFGVKVVINATGVIERALVAEDRRQARCLSKTAIPPGGMGADPSASPDHGSTADAAHLLLAEPHFRLTIQDAYQAYHV